MARHCLIQRNVIAQPLCIVFYKNILRHPILKLETTYIIFFFFFILFLTKP